MKLQTSKLCVNCESLYEDNTTCPYCMSEVFVWLNRALGTTLEENKEPVDDCTMAAEEVPASRAQVFLTGSPMISPGDTITGFRSFSEFRITLGRFGREMVRVLTFGVIQAFK